MGATANRVSYQAQTHHAALQARYQGHYMESAQTVADELGQQHGENWRPGGQPGPGRGGKGKPVDGQRESYSQH